MQLKLRSKGSSDRAVYPSGVVYSIIFIGSLFLEQSYSQTIPDKPLQLRIAPLNIIDPATGVIQVGVQKKFTSRWALSFDYGLRFNNLIFQDIKKERKEYRYSKSKAEIKYFFKSKTRYTSKGDDMYIALQGFYFPQQYRKDNSWLIRNRTSYQYSYSNISRNVAVASVLMGGEHVRGRLITDYYVGLGIRKMTIRHQPVNMVARQRLESKEWVNITPVDHNEGIFYRPHYAIGFKIGYILNK